MATIHIEGRGYSPDDLTFREQREMRTLYRELMGDPAADIAEAANMDFIPILAFIVRRRDDAAYTLEQALDMKIADLLEPEDDGPPTKGRAAAKSKTP